MVEKPPICSYYMKCGNYQLCLINVKRKEKKSCCSPLKEWHRDIYFIVLQKSQPVGKSALPVSLLSMIPALSTACLRLGELFNHI